MTPTEKAKELVNIYYDLEWEDENSNDAGDKSLPYGKAVECALLSTNEVLMCLGNINGVALYNFYTDVEDELRKLLL